MFVIDSCVFVIDFSWDSLPADPPCPICAGWNHVWLRVSCLLFLRCLGDGVRRGGSHPSLSYISCRPSHSHLSRSNAPSPHSSSVFLRSSEEAEGGRKGGREGGRAFILSRSSEEAECRSVCVRARPPAAASSPLLVGAVIIALQHSAFGKRSGRENPAFAKAVAEDSMRCGWALPAGSTRPGRSR